MSAHNRAHNFDGRMKPQSKKRGGFSQADNRRGLLAYDQHGRPFDGVIELKSNMPVGPLHPKFLAPIYPDPKYIVVNPDNPAELYIDYPNWYRDRKQNEKEYHARAVRLSAKKGWPEPKAGQYSEQVEEELGVLPPTSAAVVVAAAYQENPWLIGACRGCSTRDSRTGEFIPRFSHNCLCHTGFVPFMADSRLERFVIRPEEMLPGEDSIEDFSIDSYAKATGQTVEEVAQRPTQFRRVSRRPTVPVADGAADLADETQAQTAHVENHQAPELSEADEEQLQRAMDELETVSDDDMLFSRPELDPDEVEEVADPAALGGKTVPPAAQARAERQAPRTGNASTKTQRGAQRSAQGKRGSTRRANDKRPTLADGAKPVIGE